MPGSGGGGGGSFLSHSAVFQGMIITHNDRSIKTADWRLHVCMHFLPRHMVGEIGLQEFVFKAPSSVLWEDCRNAHSFGFLGLPQLLPFPAVRLLLLL